MRYAYVCTYITQGGMQVLLRFLYTYTRGKCHSTITAVIRHTYRTLDVNIRIIFMLSDPYIYVEWATRELFLH